MPNHYKARPSYLTYYFEITNLANALLILLEDFLFMFNVFTKTILCLGSYRLAFSSNGQTRVAPCTVRLLFRVAKPETTYLARQ